MLFSALRHQIGLHEVLLEYQWCVSRAIIIYVCHGYICYPVDSHLSYYFMTS
jgi:hypothetical protein